MTDNEMRFLELKLRAWLRKLKREPQGSVGKSLPNDWYCEIVDTAKEYLCEVVYSGQGGYVLASEESRLFTELQLAVTRAKVKEKLHQALFVDMDFEMVRDLAYGLRGQVETIMMEYKSHVEKGNEHGTKDFNTTGKNGKNPLGNTCIGKAHIQ